MSNEPYVIPLQQLRMSDVAVVGGKNASLGELISQLSAVGVKVPLGFATTSHAFRDFLKESNLAEKISQRLANLNIDNISELTEAGATIRGWIEKAPFSSAFENAIKMHFEALDETGMGSFAVRSSATAEDLPDASFAGQQETFLNVRGINNVLKTIKLVFASLYNDRAIAYRCHQGFSHDEVALSAGIQKMVRSDLASSGVMFSIDTESGFDGVIFITSSYGLGESVVQGAVNPDEFYVNKWGLKNGKDAILRRTMGSKLIQMVFEDDPNSKEFVRTEEVSLAKRNHYSISDEDINELAHAALKIEAHYQRPMDIEWGKDGEDGTIYILQARPETVKSQQPSLASLARFRLKEEGVVLVKGRAIGQKIGTGAVRVINDPSEMDKVQTGDILVADMTDPNWEPVMKRASAIVTNRGGRTCHAAIIARELGVPAVVGCHDATLNLTEGALVTVSCAQGDEGYVYSGILEIEELESPQVTLPNVDTKMMMNLGNPQLAYAMQSLPNDGVGLARLEFIINNNIGLHPQAVLDYPNVEQDLKYAIESVSRGHSSPRAFYVDKLTEGIATIAAAFYPKPVIVRLSDFKSNEYKKLIGGSRYEPDEENPMLGFRGAVRYLSEDFAQAFALECVALRRVREDMGLDNVEIMVPFVRTITQANRVLQLLSQNGLKRGENGLRLIMMCEVPSNVILANEFLELFDGFSIGSNDLTQLTLGLDRDSGMPLLAQDFDERDPAIKKLLSMAIKEARTQNKYIGICGQGPSDHIEFAQWLIKEGIVSISLNPDSIIPTWQKLA